jgi:hypothetical protein
VREFDHFGDCFCTCALIIWTVPLQKLSTEKLETTRLTHLTAKETTEVKRLEKESKMMHAYNTLISQDTSSMSDEEKVERVAAMKCFRMTLFPEMI